MKVGIDIHGIITEAPEFFSLMSKLLIEAGHEVYIITGASITKKITNKLEKHNISYTKLLSITDYLLSKEVDVRYEDADNPWFADEVWNEAKSILCRNHDIDFHMDDSDVYGDYFTTPYAMLKIKKIEK